MRRAARTDANQADIVKGLRRAGVAVEIMGKPVDLLTFWRGLWLPLEVKTEKGKLTPSQIKLVAKTKCPVVKDLQEALRAVGVIP